MVGSAPEPGLRNAGVAPRPAPAIPRADPAADARDGVWLSEAARDAARRDAERHIAQANRESRVQMPAVRRVSAAPRSAAPAALPIAAHDARWLLAQSVWANLDPGCRGALAPEKRQRLITHGVRLGLRPFDSNMVIAIVQDRARRGESLGADVAAALGLVEAPSAPIGSSDSRARGSAEALRLLAIAAGLGLVLFAVYLSWLNAG